MSPLRLAAHTGASSSADAGPSGSGGPPPRGVSGPVPSPRSLAVPLLLQLVAMVGIGALLYPQAADWFASRGQGAEVAAYVDQVDALPLASRQALEQRAAEYNRSLPEGPLQDPYTDSGAGGDAVDDPAYVTYLEQLRIEETDAIGHLTYARLGISVPIAHGTAEPVISRGAGHLYGTSLPVGGPSTHAVLTAHSGLVNASLFTSLPEAEIGDTFVVEVLGTARHYQVTALETVLPEQIDALQIEAGEDQVTLLTCTPIGINSHRLLVRGERVPAPGTAGAAELAGAPGHAGFPWWAVLFLTGSVVAAAALFLPSRNRRRGTPAPGAGSPAPAVSAPQEPS